MGKRMAQRAAALILALALAAAAGAWAAQGLPAEKDVFLIGLIPEENIFRQIQRHRPLEEYLGDRLGVRVKFTILSRYGDIVDRFASREMDGAFFGIFTSVLAMEKLSVEPVARPVSMDGGSTAQGYVFVRKDSGIKSLEDTRGKRAVFVDRATATGYIFLVALLREMGAGSLDDYFSEYYFTGSHDTAVHAVLDGRADVGTVKSRIFDRLAEKDPLIKDEIRIIARSMSLPDTTLCLSKSVPRELRDRLTETLLSMDGDAKGREVLARMGISRFTAAVRDDFGPVYELAEKAGRRMERDGRR
ncbi:MAG: phosphate/phosphite/phosphonate ABC transporter substrate-binding protein [Thermodesulfovibrionales bacterium]